MRRRQRLSALLRSYQQNVARQSGRFVTAAASMDPRAREGGIALSAIELHNTWRNFMRAYWLSSFLVARGTSGARITCGRGLLASDPIGFAVTTFRPNARPNSSGEWHRRFEPAWHDPKVLIQLTVAAQLSSAADVQTAFSINSRVFDDLPVFRNYFAHRNAASRTAALSRAPLNSVPTPARPSEILALAPPMRPQSLMLDWVDDLDLVAQYLCS